MQRLPNKISTVEEMQRQLDEMELKSLGFSASQNSLMQSMSRPDSFVIDHAHEDNHHYIKQRSTYDIAAGKQRIARLLAEIKQGKHEQLNQQMQGAGKSTIISRTESNKYLTMQSCSRSLIGQPRPPMQMTWQLGVELKAHGSIRLKTLFGEHACFGCQICQGFGHSKSDCLTENKLKLIRTRQPIYLRIFKLATAGLEMKKGIYEENWLYADLIAFASNEQRVSIGKEIGEADNMNALINVLSQEIEALSKRRCEYCDGYGHLGSDKAMVRLGKRTRVPTNAKYDCYGRTTYITYPDSCPTKHSLERSMIGFSESKNDFVAVMQNHRSRTRERYAHQQQKIEQSDKKIVTLSNLQAVDNYFKAGVLKLSEDNAGPVSLRNAVQVGQHAKEYEEKALQRREKIASVPETEQGRLEQFMDAEDEIALNDVALIDLDLDVNEKDKLAQKLIYSTRRWYLQSDIDNKELIDVAEWKDDFSNFPYVYARDSVAGEYAIALLIYTFRYYRKGFAGITKDMKAPKTDVGLQNLYGMLCTNSERTLAAFCVGGSAYRCLHSLHDHVAKKLATAGKKSNDYKDVKTSMVEDWKAPAPNQTKQRRRKYFAHYVALMDDASSKLESEIKTMQEEALMEADQDMEQL